MLIRSLRKDFTNSMHDLRPQSAATDRKRYRAGGNLGCKGKASAVHPRYWPGLRSHADRGNAGTRPDDIRRGRSHDRSCTCPTLQWCDARKASNRRRAALTSTCPAPSRACRRLSQSSSEAGRAAPQNARQATQTRHRRHRPHAGHHRKRDPENGRPMATKPGHVNTVSNQPDKRTAGLPSKVSPAAGVLTEITDRRAWASAL